MKAVFADAFYFVALLNRADQHHSKAVVNWQMSNCKHLPEETERRVELAAAYGR